MNVSLPLSDKGSDTFTRMLGGKKPGNPGAAPKHAQTTAPANQVNWWAGAAEKMYQALTMESKAE